MPGLRVPGDERRETERRVGGVERTIHTLFGTVAVRRAWYKAPGETDGRFPLDVALGLVDGYTPALAGLVCRDAAKEPFALAGRDHAAEHVAALAELVCPRQTSAWKKLRRNWTGKLWNGKIDALLTSASAAIGPTRTKEARKALAYFETNRARFQAQTGSLIKKRSRTLRGLVCRPCLDR